MIDLFYGIIFCPNAVCIPLYLQTLKDARHYKGDNTLAIW